MKAATLTQCEYCFNLGLKISRQWGLSDAEMLTLPVYQTSELFSDLDRLVLEYAVGMSRGAIRPDAHLATRGRPAPT